MTGTSSGADPDRRRAELGASLAIVEDRIAAACAAAGRDRDEVTLIVVTKFFPASDVRLLVDLGVRDVGESRAQEALAKLDDSELARARRAACFGCFVSTHFIGQLQTNKAAAVVGWADVIHTVDRPKLVRAIARAAEAADRRPSVLLQVDLEDTTDGSTQESDRGGIAPDAVADLAQLVVEQSLDLAGVMAVAPRDGDPDVAFGRLAEVSRALRVRHPEATWVSAGMSGDLEAAIRHGATHLRVGSAILGSRPTLR